MYKCPICSVEFDKPISLSIHFRSSHKKTAKELYVALNCNGVEPTCKCGCGMTVKYLGIEDGFREYVRGHASRVHNNWGHNEKVLQKSQETRREMWHHGELETWNKGLTKEADERVRANGKSSRETILNNPNELRRRSNAMRSNRLTGKIPTLVGKEHSQWKSGVSCLRAITYSRLYKEWKRPKLEKAGFRCEQCFSSNNLEVHHDKESFAEILQKLTKRHQWETSTWKVEPGWLKDDRYQEQKMKIADAVADYHINNNVSGVVLCKECHGKEHRKHDSRS
jgi:hypothetical protein